MYSVKIKEISRFSSTEIRVQFDLKKDDSAISEEEVIIPVKDLQQLSSTEKKDVLKTKVFDTVKNVLLSEEFKEFVNQEFEIK